MLPGNSPPVRSNQPGAHPSLNKQVLRHLSAPWQRPLAAHTQRVCAELAKVLHTHIAGRGLLVLDAGCGNGESSHQIAHLHPHAIVLGIDKSAHRLAQQEVPASTAKALPIAFQARHRVLFARAELQDFWRFAYAAGWRFAAQYLLYPNPWPKSGHLQRRWQGHPVWPFIVATGGVLELRSNWLPYVHEFATALQLCGASSRMHTLCASSPSEPGAEACPPVSPFERKYRASGQVCWKLSADLDAARLPATWQASPHAYHQR